MLLVVGLGGRWRSELHRERTAGEHVHPSPDGTQAAEALRELGGAVQAHQVRRRPVHAERAQVPTDGAYAVRGGRRRHAPIERRRRMLQDGVEGEVGKGGREALRGGKVEEGALRLGHWHGRRVGRRKGLPTQVNLRLQGGLQRDARLQKLHQLALLDQRDRARLENVGLTAWHAPPHRVRRARRECAVVVEVRLQGLELKVVSNSR